MALVLDHLRKMPEDMQPIGQRFNNSVTALVGCVMTAANCTDRLSDTCASDLAARASRRVDEVSMMTRLASQIRPTISDKAIQDALTSLKTTLAVLGDSWNELPHGERRRLLKIAVQALARFCYLSRPVISPPDAKGADSLYA